MTDKNLFLYDLAVTAILKDEGRYLKEWLDYHLLAGVDHFYLFDNDSTDNQAEVARPYVEAGLVDYIFAPGQAMQFPVYNDAIKRFKFFSRYIAFIDGDEFIFPKTNQSIIEVVDEILSRDESAAGLAINWQTFGSNNHETADYSRGVLERFTRRAPTDWSPNDHGNKLTKVVANPRTINSIIYNPHTINYFEPFYTVNENGTIVKISDEGFETPVSVEKIAVNHYHCKSWEEYSSKNERGDVACVNYKKYTRSMFDTHDRNEVFDDGILRYRAARAQNFSLKDEAERFNRVAETLTRILSAFAVGKKVSMETALTCRALSAYLLEKFPDNAERWKVYEEAAFAAILNSLDDLSLEDAHMLIRELPKLLCRSYPAAEFLRGVAAQIIRHFKDNARLSENWQCYIDLDYLEDILKFGG